MHIHTCIPKAANLQHCFVLGAPLQPLQAPSYPHTHRLMVRTIQGALPRDGTASSIRGCVFTKVRISSGKVLEEL